MNFKIQKKILILGYGFIGKNLSNLFLSKGYYVVVISRSKKESYDSNLLHIRMDILKDNYSELKKMDFDFCIYAISIMPAGKILNKREFDDEIDLYIKFTDLTNSINNTCVILISSASVYGNTKIGGSSESISINPLGLYGKLKYKIEKIAVDQANISQNKLIILRVSNLYGPYQMRQGIVHHLLTAAMSQSRIIINNLGETIRDFLYIDDFNHAVFLLTERPSQELIAIFNISSNVKTSINQIICLLSFEFPQIYKFIEINDQPDEIPENVLDNSKFRNVFPKWAPLTLAEGIKSTIHWIKP